MKRLLLRLSPVLHLARVSSAIGVVANAWFVVLWTRGMPQEPGHAGDADTPLVVLLAGATLAAVGLYAFAVGLNDLLDVKRDRALRPGRPIASGDMSHETAVYVVVGSLLASILGAAAFDTAGVVLTGVLALLILIFNTAARFVPAVGLGLLGFIHAGHMFVPNIELAFLWPVWLIMTHMTVVHAVAYRMSRKVPPISGRALAAIVATWVGFSLCLAALAWDRGGLWPDWVAPTALIWPLLVAGLCAAWCARRVGASDAGRAAEKVVRYGSLWPAFYGVAWLAGAGQWPQAWIMAGLALAGIAGLTALREGYALVQHPPGYRRRS